MGKVLGNKFIVIGGSFIALLALGVVLGLTVVRIQNEKATIGRPKAANECSNPSPDCCGSLGSDYFGCAWPDRGWCTKSQCGGPALARSAANGGNQNCGLFRQTYCQSGGWCSNNDDCYGGQTCNGGVCTTPSPQPSYTATYPKGGEQVGSLSPTFTWTGSMPANNNYKNICIGTWVSSSSCDSVGCFSVAGNSYTHPAPLVANTIYGWTVYSARSPGTLDVTNMAGGCQQFKTGAGISCPSGQILCGSSCVNPNTDNANCGACGVACGTGKTCTSGVCAANPTHFECVSKACASVAGAGDNKNGCTTPGGICCTGSSDCSSGQSCDSTKTPNVCIANPTHFECVNKACKKVDGAGDNKNGCSVEGGTCCGSSSDCASGQSCDTTKTPNACSSTDEVNACWGNGGTSGKCYDCNGDGEVNILDFACFRAKYNQNVL